MVSCYLFCRAHLLMTKTKRTKPKEDTPVLRVLFAGAGFIALLIVLLMVPRYIRSHFKKGIVRPSLPPREGCLHLANHSSSSKRKRNSGTMEPQRRRGGYIEGNNKRGAQRDIMGVYLIIGGVLARRQDELIPPSEDRVVTFTTADSHRGKET